MFKRLSTTNRSTRNNIREELLRLYFDNGVNSSGKKTVMLFSVDESDLAIQADTWEKDIRYLANIKGS